MKKKCLLLLFSAIIIVCTACSISSNNVAHSITLHNMDTIMQLTAYGANGEIAIKAASDEINRLDNLLSTGKADSEISLLNKSGSAFLSDDSLYLVQEAIKLFHSTGGAFDITIFPLVTLWGFPSGSPALPSQNDIDQVLPYINSEYLLLTDNYLSIDSGQSIDFGGIAKGYTSQRVMDIFRSSGVKSGLISLGGNVHCLGTKPDGSLWRIGIKAPSGPDGSLIAVVSVQDTAVITSGGYERFFDDENTGIRYHHILNPETGYPAQSGLSSVTIITDNGTLGDGLSTALFIMGLDKAYQYWMQSTATFEAVLITDDNVIYATGGLEGSISADQEIHYLYK